MDVAVLGNTTLDIICKPVDDVPRYDSIAFDNVVVAPGGCGSNVAIWLGALGVSTTLIARIGLDNAAFLVERYWRSVGLDLSQVTHTNRLPTGTSVALVDSHAQPRFIHTSGANAELTVDSLDVEFCVATGVRLLHVAGFFVLPGLMDGRLPHVLKQVQDRDIYTTLDVVGSRKMEETQSLWACLPHLDVFMCNAAEAEKITGINEPGRAAKALRERGLRIAIIKLGELGCWLETKTHSTRIPAPEVKAVDTTGAGDAFAAGLIAGIINGEELPEACLRGNEVGARAITHLGAVGPWMDSRIK